jgi:hypothetical protein
VNDGKLRFSELLTEDRVAFFIGNEANHIILETLCRRFKDLNFDHVVNAVWAMEHRGVDSVAPGVRTLCGRLAEINDIRVAIGISKQALRNAACGERVFLLFLTPYGQRFESRVFVRAATRLFQNSKLVVRLSKLWSPADVLMTLRDAEQSGLPHQKVFAAA